MPEVTPSKYLVRTRAPWWHKPDRQKRCIRCGDTKPLSGFYAYGYTTRQGKPGIRYESRCRPCARERRRERFAAFPQKEASAGRNWRAKNVEYIRAFSKSWRADPAVKREKARYQRIRAARQRVGMDGREDRDAVKAIYRQAADLQQLFGVKFHVDHIKPLVKGGKHIAENLQVLLAIENLKKGGKDHA